MSGPLNQHRLTIHRNDRIIDNQRVVLLYWIIRRHCIIEFAVRSLDPYVIKIVVVVQQFDLIDLTAKEIINRMSIDVPKAIHRYVIPITVHGLNCEILKF